jgi:hypothetical protein
MEKVMTFYKDEESEEDYYILRINTLIRGISKRNENKCSFK